MMWLLLLLVYISHPSEGQRIILKDGSNPCEGHVEVYYDNKWGYVGDKYWSTTTEEMACRTTHCGNPLLNTTDVERVGNKPVWLNEVKCNGKEENLWKCEWPGWKISSYKKPSVKKIKCSNKIKFDLDGYNCAGAVRFSIDDGKTWAGYLCADKLGKPEADDLCKSLKCGESKESTVDNWMIWEQFQNTSQQKMMINCPDNSSMDNLWQCVTEVSAAVCSTPVSVVCDGYERLQLRGKASNVCSGQLEIMEKDKWIPVNNNNNRQSLDARCKQMHCGKKVKHTVDGNGTQLTCSDEVKVVLMDNNNPSFTTKCYGAVHIRVNNKTHPVCGSHWDKSAAEVVCKELKCGKVISYNNDYQTNDKGVMDNMKCLGTEASLWHCRAKHGQNSGLIDCTSKAYVVCADSIDVRLMDGPERCAGRVEINYEGSWRQVGENGWKEENTHTVCKQTKCGNKGKSSPEKFSKGSDNFLRKAVNCQSSTSKISDCLVNDSKLDRDQEPVGIICKKHTVVFLKGDASSPCSGMVGIEHDDNTKWLSGSDKAWNQDAANAVCQQKKCGKASNFSAIIATTDMQAQIWDKSYNCSENSTSLFNCKTTALPSDHNKTIAAVICKGTVKFTMENGCWGKVVANVTGKTGGVCQDTWTLKHSEMLCMSQGCGSKVVKANTQLYSQPVLIKSVHSTKDSTNLTQCNFVLNDDSKCQNPAYVVCSGSVKPRFSDSVDKCSGNVAVFYDGKWLPVCTSALENEDARHTICQELGCGQALKQISYFGPKPKESHVISQLECKGAKSLSECNITSVTQDCIPAGLECADWRKMAVRGTCSGPVSVHSNEKRHAVSFEGWTDSEGEQLCQDLDCGHFKSKSFNPVNNKQAFWSKNFNCSTKQSPKNIWDCENTSPSPSPSFKKQLNIECADKPKILLSEHCHGEVKINGMQVCNQNWNKNYSDLLCQEMNCSNAVHNNPTAIKSQSHDKYQHVHCDPNHHELSQCKRRQGKCDGQLMSVYCVGSFQINTTEKCGGEIRLWNGVKWQKMCPLGRDDSKTAELICEELGCKKPRTFTPKPEKKKESMNFGLNCTSHHMDIKHCIIEKQCTEKAAEIYCDDYIPPEPKSPDPSPPSVPLIVGLVLLFVMVILIVAFVRICIIKRARDNKNMRLRMMAGDEMGFESGDYEDVKEDEMEDLNHGNFRSESDIMEKDARSASSLPYDDIDEVVEAQPLTSQAAAPRDRSIQQDTLDQNGITYEVDDPQESYDDIDVSPEIKQTTAEVHDSLVPTLESNTGASSQVMQEDGDYVEPDQDG